MSASNRIAEYFDDEPNGFYPGDSLFKKPIEAKIKKPKTDWIVVFTVVFIVTISLAVVTALTAVAAASFKILFFM